jgi:hypothetical protein
MRTKRRTLHFAFISDSDHGDLSYAAAFVMHNVPLLTDLDLWSYWTL